MTVFLILCVQMNHDMQGWNVMRKIETFKRKETGMEGKSYNNRIVYIISGVGLLFLLSLQFCLHRFNPFINDDLWYATNLTTGEPITGIKDILQSQNWHYFNWGGRIVNHAVLQAVLSLGEFGADIANILATIVLGIVICTLSQCRDPLYFLFCEALIVSFNANIIYSMYWESGSVNYLYSSSWILLYLFVTLRELKEDVRELKGTAFWIVPLAFIAGMSNENMGPSCFVATAFVIIYLYRKKKKVPITLWEGAVFTLIGSVLLIFAPGNFVRNQFIQNMSLSETIDHCWKNFLFSSCDYLFPSFLLTVILLTVEIAVFKHKLTVYRWCLLGFAVIAELAMMLSPTYPQRASFGIMCVLIAFILSSFKKISDMHKTYANIIMVVVLSIYIHALIAVAANFVFPTF